MMAGSRCVAFSKKVMVCFGEQWSSRCRSPCSPWALRGRRLGPGSAACTRRSPRSGLHATAREAALRVVVGVVHDVDEVVAVVVVRVVLVEPATQSYSRWREEEALEEDLEAELDQKCRYLPAKFERRFECRHRHRHTPST